MTLPGSDKVLFAFIRPLQNHIEDDRPYQHLSQSPGALPVDKLLGVRQLNVHIRVHADQSTLVFRLAPF